MLTGTRILNSDPLPGTPDQIEHAVRGLQLEGVVAKRRRSIYEPGRRSASWIKVKFNRRQEFVIGGFKPNDANLESVVVGYYESRKLLFAGRVRAGLTPLNRTEVFRRIAGDQNLALPVREPAEHEVGALGRGHHSRGHDEAPVGEAASGHRSVVRRVDSRRHAAAL